MEYLTNYLFNFCEEYVDTSRNKFTGLIPSELTKLSSLSEFSNTLVEV